jgi:diguanylate cyclase
VTGQAPRVGRAWVVGLVAGAIACLALLVVPVESLAWVLLARGAGAMAVLAFFLTNLRMPERTRQVWWAIWGYAALTVAADIVYDAQQRISGEPPFPGPADVLYLAAYGSALLGLLLLVRRVHPDRDRDAWIDTMVLSIAAAAAVGVLIVAPTFSDGTDLGLGTAIALSYPLLDILLLSGLIRLVVGGGRRSLSVTLLLSAFGMTLAADLAYNGLVTNGLEGLSPAWLDALFLASIVTMALSASAPGARVVDAPSGVVPRDARSGSLLGLTVGALTIPCILVFVAWGDGGLAARLLSVASVAVILLVVWRLRRLIRTVQAQSARLSEQARTDSLTGLPNRRTLDYELERAVRHATESGTSLVVAMLDLDHFKEFNDRHGHQAGDVLLKASTRAWDAAVPANAFLARYGGEEFALLLPGQPEDGARRILERLRGCMPAGQTVSIGYATRLPGESGLESLLRADQALYAAKAAGRDRVVAAEPARHGSVGSVRERDRDAVDDDLGVDR